MMSDIRCATCYMMTIAGRAKETGNNSHFAGTRGKCYCGHPGAEDAFKFLCRDSSRMPGFVAFTRKGGNEPDIKTAPRWCPRRMAEVATEIGKREAYQIIDSRRPLGLFFLKEGDGYTGIDNRTGDAWTEEFPTKSECLKWLPGEEGRERDE